jgi:hypothetical protein
MCSDDRSLAIRQALNAAAAALELAVRLCDATDDPMLVVGEVPELAELAAELYSCDIVPA